MPVGNDLINCFITLKPFFGPLSILSCPSQSEPEFSRVAGPGQPTDTKKNSTTKMTTFKAIKPEIRSQRNAFGTYFLFRLLMG
jgi:hypothetical protein